MLGEALPDCIIRLRKVRVYLHHQVKRRLPKQKEVSKVG